MKRIYYFLLPIICFSCKAPVHMTEKVYRPQLSDDITTSLFQDKDATISEENINRILNGTYSLPDNLRVAILQIDNRYNVRRNYWNNELYVKSEQKFLKNFTDILQSRNKVKSVTIIPEILVSNSPTFTQIREAAVRTQADIVLIYTITSDVYSKYKAFGKDDFKAFATTQVVIMDVRTGLIPFTDIKTQEAFGQKLKGDLDNAEIIDRVKGEAVNKTIQAISHNLINFLNR